MATAMPYALIVTLCIDLFCIWLVTSYIYCYFAWPRALATVECNVRVITEGGNECIKARMLHKGDTYRKHLFHPYSSKKFSAGDQVLVMYNPQRPSSFKLVNFSVGVTNPLIGVVFFSAILIKNL